MSGAGIEERLRADLRAAIGGDREVVSALRVALGALANAEAVPLGEATAGVGEVDRRTLDEDERRAVVADVIALHPETDSVLRPYLR